MSKLLAHGIVAPHDHDVLSGRGNFVNYHAGNEHFRALVRKHKLAYVACPKPQKGKFSKMIVDEIRDRDPPGRFLKQDAKTKLWYDIGEKKALDKTRQALREGAPEIMKELHGDDESCEENEDPDSPTGSPASGNGPMARMPSLSLSPDMNAPLMGQQLATGTGGLGVANQMIGFNGLNPSSTGAAQFDSYGINDAVSVLVASTPNPTMSQNGHAALALSTQQRLSPSNIRTPNNGMMHNLAGSSHGQLAEQQQKRELSLSLSHHSSHHQHSRLSVMPQQQLQPAPLQTMQQQQQQQQSQQPQPVTIPHSQVFPSVSTQLGGGVPMQSQSSRFAHAPQHLNSMAGHSFSRMNRQHGTGLSHQSTVQGNAHAGPYTRGDLDMLQNKISTLQHPGHLYTAEQLEPRHIDYSLSTGRQTLSLPLHDRYPKQMNPAMDRYPVKYEESQEERGCEERVAPLPPRRVPIKLKREGSENSLQVDNIFGGRRADECSVGGSTSIAGSDRARFNNSNMSIMSLSLNDVHQVPDHANHDTATPENLSSLFNSSLRVSERKFPPYMQHAPPRRTGSGDHGDLSHAVMDMSVATLGDRLSELGDASMIRMMESQANMSFSNVFEETDRELLNHA